MSKEQKSGNAHQQHTPQTGQEHSPVRQAQDKEHHAQAQLGQEQQQAHQIPTNETHGKHHFAHGKHQEHVAPSKKGVAIYINRMPYHVPSDTFKASLLRELSSPPIEPGQSLFRVYPGKHEDVKLNDSDMITINLHDPAQGRHFYSDAVTPTHEAVASKAFSLYVENGCQDGHDAEHWAQAEAELKVHSQKKQ